MAKVRDTKNRINAVSKTRKITRTMEMVSTSKLKRWQTLVLASRPYSEALKEVLLQLSSSPAALSHPLMEQRKEIRRAAVLFITSNRGLCGAFNNIICKKAHQLRDDYSRKGAEIELFAVGKKGISYFRHLGIPLAYTDISIADKFSSEQCRELTRLLSDAFLTHRVDRVEVVYVNFISAGSQRLVSEQLFPLSVPAGPEREIRETDFIFEPDPEEIVNTLLPLFAQSTIYRMIAENTASEQAARRKAMKQATDNAEDMITYLTRRLNRERQYQITKELSEIVGGSEAIKAG